VQATVLHLCRLAGLLHRGQTCRALLWFPSRVKIRCTAYDEVILLGEQTITWTDV